MILREIKNMYIKNRLTEGVDFVRKEWLKGDGSAYIILGTITPSVTITLKLDYNIELEGLYPLGGRIFGNGNKRLMWNQVGNDEEGLEFYYNGNLKVLWNAHRSMSDIYTITITDTDIAVNGIKRIYKGIEGDYNNYMLFHQQNTTITRAYSGSIMLFSDGTKKLVPCTLLRSIPATLDANNRARQAGECGMYDSVSGKFYGNVANSGTFTAEGEVEPETHTGLQQIYQNRLIEGVDYETYDWLKADIPIDTKMMNLPINSRNFEFKRNWIQLMNSWYFSTLNSTNASYSYFITDNGDSNDRCPQIWDNTNKRIIFTSSINVGLGIHTISANDNRVTISSVTNTASPPWYGTTEIIVFIVFNNSSNVNKNTICLTSSIKVDGVTRYVPCQLLRSIPRNLDAQCKARVAGECGMIDLISGKFYGNVANTGTFTVENDNE